MKKQFNPLEKINMVNSADVIKKKRRKNVNPIREEFYAGVKSGRTYEEMYEKLHWVPEQHSVVVDIKPKKNKLVEFDPETNYNHFNGGYHKNEKAYSPMLSKSMGICMHNVEFENGKYIIYVSGRYKYNAATVAKYELIKNVVGEQFVELRPITVSEKRAYNFGKIDKCYIKNPSINANVMKDHSSNLNEFTRDGVIEKMYNYHNDIVDTYDNKEYKALGNGKQVEVISNFDVGELYGNGK